MRTGTGGARDGSGAKAPGRWRTSPPQVQSVRAGPAVAPTDANRPRLLPSGSLLPLPPEGWGQVDLGVGGEGKRAEDGDGEGPGSLAQAKTCQSST